MYLFIYLFIYSFIHSFTYLYIFKLLFPVVVYFLMTSLRLIYSYSLLHNITSNRTGVNVNFCRTENNISNLCAIISENKKETFRV